MVSELSRVLGSCCYLARPLLATRRRSDKVVGHLEKDRRFRKEMSGVDRLLVLMRSGLHESLAVTMTLRRATAISATNARLRGGIGATARAKRGLIK